MITRDELKQTLLRECPFASGLQAADVVTFTNEYGVKFENLTIIGFSAEKWYDRYIYLDKDSYWFPVDLKSISKNN